jgi:hypothetical protein
MSKITFIVPGQESVGRGAGGMALPAGLMTGRVRHSIRIDAARGGAGEARISAVEGEDVVVLHIQNGPTLVLHPATARDLFLGQSSLKRSSGGAGLAEISVPAQLRWKGIEETIIVNHGSARGFLGDVVLSAVEVITGVAKDPAVKLLASAVVERVDGQVDTGVYQLTPEALPSLKNSGRKLNEIKPSADDAPILVLVHGTFSSTQGTFGKLWTSHPQHVRSLFRRYGNRVYALDHPTLGASPIRNLRPEASTRS